MVREAYFLWYGVMFNYSRLRTFGSRAYAINHVGLKDYGARSVAGIFVGFNQSAPDSIAYELYLPQKNVFVTSGDVVFCEHTGRSEPERLLPPHLMLLDGVGTLDAKDYQHLVDTIHLDSEEGVQYKVLRVYKKKGFVVVDRVLYFSDKKLDEKSNLVDIVYLQDIINYPIILGRKKPQQADRCAAARFRRFLSFRPYSECFWACESRRPQ